MRALGGAGFVSDIHGYRVSYAGTVGPGVVASWGRGCQQPLRPFSITYDRGILQYLMFKSLEAKNEN